MSSRWIRKKMRIWTFHLWANWFNQGPLSTFEILKLILFGDNELAKLVKHELGIPLQKFENRQLKWKQLKSEENSVAFDCIISIIYFWTIWQTHQFEIAIENNLETFSIQLLEDQPVKHFWVVLFAHSNWYFIKMAKTDK